jgi:GTPase
MERTKNQLFRILKSQHAKKLPITVRDEKDIATCLDNNQSMRICPVFLCSAVTGKGMDLLIKYLSGLRPRRDWQITRKDKLTEFHIDETFNVRPLRLAPRALRCFACVLVRADAW